ADDAATGAILWSHVGIQEVAGLVGGASAAVVGDLAIAPYTSGEIFALRPENGRVAWSDSLSRTGRLTALAEISDIAGLPVIDRGLAIVVGHAGRMAAIDVRSGTGVWELDLASVQSPWVAGQFIFAVTVNGEAVAVSRSDGRVRWVHQLPRFENEAAREDPIQWAGPVLAGDRLVFASSAGEVTALSPYDGRLLGTLRLGGGVSVAPIVADETLYILDDRGVLHAFR
ncbi:MAG: PQQ-binding-like beta-propeller repeat protein, partial [Proteobacteria bacterium]|nr:PQQ-binding-like beta-propeller repeat protein [Pseudomonadota bacterium]